MEVREFMVDLPPLPKSYWTSASGVDDAGWVGSLLPVFPYPFFLFGTNGRRKRKGKREMS